jgi:hypothetical protein
MKEIAEKLGEAIMPRSGGTFLIPSTKSKATFPKHLIGNSSFDVETQITS